MLSQFHLASPGPHALQQIMDSVPIVQALALKAWALESNPWCRLDRVSDGYIAQERHRLHSSLP